MRPLTTTALLLGSLLSALVSGTPVNHPSKPISTAGPRTVNKLAARDLLTPLQDKATALEHKWQPVLDFDKDSCYNTAAVDSSGNKNPGLSAGQGVPPSCFVATCRDNDRLEHSNAYSRSRCNNGWCAIVYDYYFERDQRTCGSYINGHRHDWETIVVFVKDDQLRRVAPSCHDKFDGATDSPRMEGNRAKVVYHKDGISTHCFRMGREDDDNIENFTGGWFLDRLVGWTGWPSDDFRNSALDWGDDGPQSKLPDKHFAGVLRSAAGQDILDDGFNPDVDG